MHKTISKTFYVFFLLLLPRLGSAQREIIFTAGYNWLSTDTEAEKLLQKHDTLYGIKWFTNRPGDTIVVERNKILSVGTKGEFTFLKLEGLDSIPLSTDPYPANHYKVMIFKNIDRRQIGLLNSNERMTKEQLNAYSVDTSALGNQFFFTLFSDEYLKTLSQLQPLKTKADAQKIIAMFNSDNFKPLIELYSKSHPEDIYGAGIRTELLTLSCIASGFNPIGAGPAINKMMRQ